MTLAAYTGHEALTFPDYLDQGTGRTLTAEPGGTYDITPASGRLVPDIPRGWFTPVFAAGHAVSEPEEQGAPAEGDGALPGDEDESGGEPNGEPE